MRKALTSAEAKLGIVFRAGYRRAFRTRNFLTGLEGYELPEPLRCYRLSDEDWARLDMRKKTGWVIGHAVCGDPIFLRFSRASKTELADQVWVMSHEDGKSERLAPTLDDLFEPASHNRRPDLKRW